MRAKETSILQFIGGRNISFIIPPFQRNYEWTNVQCSELYDDLKHAAKSERNHYLGNIVYYKAKTKASFHEYILVDGQQRFTSIMLLLAAIRDLLDDQKQKKGINDDYLKHDESKLSENEEEYRIRLKQETSSDYPEFKAIIDNLDFDENSSSKIISNYLYFKRAIADDLEKKVVNSLNDLYDAVERLEIVEVDLDIQNNNLDDVQLIFEKINSTGKPLTFSDLIRNFLLISKDSRIQKKLFENYWKKIENDLGPGLLDPFMSCYLTYKVKEDIKSVDKYRKFKEFFKDQNREEILKELLELEPFYKFFKTFETNNTKIKKSIDPQLQQYLKMLCLLKAQDIDPLLLQVYPVLYDTDKVELKKVIRLFVDFMTRYRIVSPSKGGNALTTTTLNLLKKLSNSDIQTNYDDILFVLSNSQTDEGRFPSNDEFKDALMNTSLNMAYARVCLVRIEDHETKNIPVPIECITVEHLLPQTKNSWWINHLGGDDEYHKIYNRYLNCIGNLTPISPNYNSSVSNKPWQDKLDAFKKVQFNITKQLVDTYPTCWKEPEISDRNSEIANRACEALTSPLERTIPVSVIPESQEDVIQFADLNTELDGTSIIGFRYEEEQYEVNSWRELLSCVCVKMYQLDPNKFDKLVSENLIHKSTRKRVVTGKDPIISTDPSKFNSSLSIQGSPYFVEGKLSSQRVRVYCKQLLEYYGQIDNCSYTVLLN